MYHFAGELCEEVVGFRKEEEGKMSDKLHVIGMSDNFWDRAREDAKFLIIIEESVGA